MTSEQREVDPRRDVGELTRNQSHLMSPHQHETRRATMSQSSTLSIGMDGPKESIAGAYGATDHDAAVLSLGTFGTRPCDIDTLIRKLPSKAKHLVFVYAAGPCGSWLSRSLTKKDAVCWGGRPPSCQKRRVTGSPPTGVTLCHWPGAGAPGTAPPWRCLPSPMQRSAT